DRGFESRSCRSARARACRGTTTRACRTRSSSSRGPCASSCVIPKRTSAWCPARRTPCGRVVPIWSRTVAAARRSFSCSSSVSTTSSRSPERRADMGYDYKRYFAEITTLHDLTTRPEERTWRLAAPPRDAEPHAVVLYLGCNVLRTAHLVQTVTPLLDR